MVEQPRLPPEPQQHTMSKQQYHQWFQSQVKRRVTPDEAEFYGSVREEERADMVQKKKIPKNPMIAPTERQHRTMVAWLRDRETNDSNPIRALASESPNEQENPQPPPPTVQQQPPPERKEAQTQRPPEPLRAQGPSNPQNGAPPPQMSHHQMMQQQMEHQEMMEQQILQQQQQQRLAAPQAQRPPQSQNGLPSQQMARQQMVPHQNGLIPIQMMEQDVIKMQQRMMEQHMMQQHEQNRLSGLQSAQRPLQPQNGVPPPQMVQQQPPPIQQQPQQILQAKDNRIPANPTIPPSKRELKNMEYWNKVTGKSRPPPQMVQQQQPLNGQQGGQQQRQQNLMQPPQMVQQGPQLHQQMQQNAMPQPQMAQQLPPPVQQPQQRPQIPMPLPQMIPNPMFLPNALQQQQQMMMMQQQNPLFQHQIAMQQQMAGNLMALGQQQQPQNPSEQQRAQEQQRLREQQRLQEQQKIQEQQKLLQEQKRIQEQHRLQEQERLLQEQRKLEEQQRLHLEQQKIKKKQLEEQKRMEEQQKALEQQRLLQEQQKIQEQQRAQKRQPEQRRNLDQVINRLHHQKQAQAQPAQMPQNGMPPIQVTQAQFAQLLQQQNAFNQMQQQQQRGPPQPHNGLPPQQMAQQQMMTHQNGVPPLQQQMPQQMMEQMMLQQQQQQRLAGPQGAQMPLQPHQNGMPPLQMMQQLAHQNLMMHQKMMGQQMLQQQQQHQGPPKPQQNRAPPPQNAQQQKMQEQFQRQQMMDRQLMEQRIAQNQMNQQQSQQQSRQRRVQNPDANGQNVLRGGVANETPLLLQMLNDPALDNASQRGRGRGRTRAARGTRGGRQNAQTRTDAPPPNQRDRSPNDQRQKDEELRQKAEMLKRQKSEELKRQEAEKLKRQKAEELKRQKAEEQELKRQKLRAWNEKALAKMTKKLGESDIRVKNAKLEMEQNIRITGLKEALEDDFPSEPGPSVPQRKEYPEEIKPLIEQAEAKYTRTTFISREPDPNNKIIKKKTLVEFFGKGLRGIRAASRYKLVEIHNSLVSKAKERNLGDFHFVRTHRPVSNEELFQQIKEVAEALVPGKDMDLYLAQVLLTTPEQNEEQQEEQNGEQVEEQRNDDEGRQMDENRESPVVNTPAEQSNPLELLAEMAANVDKSPDSTKEDDESEMVANCRSSTLNVVGEEDVLARAVSPVPSREPTPFNPFSPTRSAENSGVENHSEIHEEPAEEMAEEPFDIESLACPVAMAPKPVEKPAPVPQQEYVVASIFDLARNNHTLEAYGSTEEALEAIVDNGGCSHSPAAESMIHERSVDSERSDRTTKRIGEMMVKDSMEEESTPKRIKLDERNSIEPSTSSAAEMSAFAEESAVTTEDLSEHMEDASVSGEEPSTSTATDDNQPHPIRQTLNSEVPEDALNAPQPDNVRIKEEPTSDGAMDSAMQISIKVEGEPAEEPTTSEAGPSTSGIQPQRLNPGVIENPLAASQAAAAQKMDLGSKSGESK
ncbi:hypothetical protein CAEBREN_21386 [Caenorhabditis brenneri]|uniref:Uncharacterized protein n=1 Tax=Caenorhabditis brenneri TaxID=135651 RepID=G0NZY4_CAEBE|nr:hypothetical protein CAEBREN_21386 [Caenorhabditis brenneri]